MIKLYTIMRGAMMDLPFPEDLQYVVGRDYRNGNITVYGFPSIEGGSIGTRKVNGPIHALNLPADVVDSADIELMLQQLTAGHQFDEAEKFINGVINRNPLQSASVARGLSVAKDPVEEFVLDTERLLSYLVQNVPNWQNR